MLVTILRTVDHIPVHAVHHAATIGQTFMLARSGNCFRRSCRFRNPKVTLMNKLASIVFAAGLALLTTGAQAMPLAAIDASNGAVIIQVAQGCGPGGHRCPFGHCRPLHDRPPGWHTGPYGVHCFRNQPPVISG
jgi:hypothetical protein